MKSEYTKGKWRINGGVIETESKEKICVVGVVNEQTYQNTANAQLIASAPELLEACKDVLKWFNSLKEEQIERTCKSFEDACNNWNIDSNVKMFDMDKIQKIVNQAEGRA